ncbi:GpE family phage tail protein [Pasteurellaceae bacterium HPA106]|nr:GpE family phage tail protein [Spirabiliibacterium pneumoniae]
MSELEQMNLDDLENWLSQAKRQIKAGYEKAAH